MTLLLTTFVVELSISRDSVVIGVNRGARWIANFALILILCFPGVLFVFGPSFFGPNTMDGSILRNLGGLPSLILDAPVDLTFKTSRSAYSWHVDWAAWWFAFATFVGLTLRDEIGRQDRSAMVFAQ